MIDPSLPGFTFDDDSISLIYASILSHLEREIAIVFRINLVFLCSAMGISGLLPLLKSIQVNTHIKQYAGKVVGIDAYGWLHRGAFACAWDLALGNPTTKSPSPRPLSY